MRLPAQIKRKAVLEVINDKKSVSEVAEKHGIARKTLYQWIKRYENAPARKRKDALEPQYVKGKDHPKAYRQKIKTGLIKEVVKNPHLSATSLANNLNTGRHAVVNLLTELDLSTSDARQAFTSLYSSPTRLKEDIKSSICRKISEGEGTISSISKEYGVARKTLYQWIKRYQEEGGVKERYVSGHNHPKAFSKDQEQAILSQVVKAPELSIHNLAKNTPFSSHGVYNVLKRYNLTYKDARLTYASSQKPVKEVVGTSQVFDRVKSVFDQFIPTRAPAPPPGIQLLAKSFFLALILSFVISYGSASWIKMVYRCDD
ncbi:helix-turn-helix domain-containing protein [Patescibacteria group bacterium]